MAAPADVQRRNTTPQGSDLAEMKLQLNNLITKFRALCTKLDSDAGVTDVNYFGTLADSGAADPPTKITSVF